MPPALHSSLPGYTELADHASQPSGQPPSQQPSRGQNSGCIFMQMGSFELSPLKICHTLGQSCVMDFGISSTVMQLPPSSSESYSRHTSNPRFSRTFSDAGQIFVRLSLRICMNMSVIMLLKKKSSFLALPNLGASSALSLSRLTNSLLPLPFNHRISLQNV